MGDLFGDFGVSEGGIGDNLDRGIELFGWKLVNLGIDKWITCQVICKNNSIAEQTKISTSSSLSGSTESRRW